MHLLMLVSDFAEVMHVQRPEEGTAQHVQPQSMEAVAERPVPRSRFARLLHTIRAPRLRHALKRPAA
jgi:hypothetical protein